MGHTCRARGGVLRGLALSALAAAVACGGAARGPAGGAGAAAPDRQLSEEIAALRIRLAEDPRDADLHRALGRALLRAERPGGAIRHLSEVRRRGALTGADRRALARLLLERAEARLSSGDGEAWRDLDEAARLDRNVARRPALERDLLLAGARADLRRSDRPGRERARRLLARAARLAPADPRLALLDPRRADLVALGVAAAWLHEGGARRAALEAYRVYLQRGGRAADHLRRALALHRWWVGDRRRPTGLLLDDARRAGLDLCGLARVPDELGCAAATARAAAEPTGRAAAAILQRAARLGWRVDDPAAVGPWMALSIGAWLRGEVEDWTAALAARLDLDALTAPGRRAQVPAHLLPTVLRAAGSAEAAAAFDRAVEHAAALSPPARALLLAEALAQGRAEGTIDRILHAGEASPLAWRLALRAASEAEPGGAREASLVERAPARVVLAHLRETGALGALAARRPAPAVVAALGRWRAALAGTPLEAGRDAVEAGWRRLSSGAPPASSGAPRAPTAPPLGVIDPHRLTDDPQLARALGRIARAWRRDPAAADRLAADLLDRWHAALEPGLAVIELFARLDDPARAWRWVEPLTRQSPHEPRVLMAAGAVSAAAGAVSRAEIFFLRGAAASGDPGEASLQAARAYLVTGHPLAAVSAARRAVQHSAPGQPEQDEAIALAALALEELGRQDDAGALRARLPAAAAPASAASRGEPEEAAPASAPRLPAVDPSDPAWAEAVARELARALIAPPERAAPALDRLAAALDRAGHRQLAHAVRRERRAVAPLAPLAPLSP